MGVPPQPAALSFIWSGLWTPYRFTIHSIRFSTPPVQGCGSLWAIARFAARTMSRRPHRLTSGLGEASHERHPINQRRYHGRHCDATLLALAARVVHAAARLPWLRRSSRAGGLHAS